MCHGAAFYAENASKLRITGKGDHSLDTASIYCPEKGDCIIDIINGNDALNHIMIYINEPKDVNLQISCPHASGNQCYAAGPPDVPILKCYKGLHQCILITNNGKDWHCQNPQSPCNMNSTWITSTTSTTTIAPNATTTSTSSTTTTIMPNITNTTLAPTQEPTLEPTTKPHGGASNNDNKDVDIIIIGLIIALSLIALISMAVAIWTCRRRHGSGSGVERLIKQSINN